MPFSRLLSWAAPVVLCFASPLSLAATKDITDYDIYYGDINNDGDNTNIHLHIPDQFVLIHGDIAVPLLIPKEGGVTYNASENSLSARDLEQDEADAYTAALEDVDYLYEDANGDGHTDVRVYSQNNDGSGVIFYGNGTGALPTAQAFTFASAPYSSSFASSSQLKAGQADIKIFTATESGQDVVTMSAPNANGVSVNRFAEFDVTDRDLSIMNHAGWHNDQFGNQVWRDAAQTIVVIADRVTLTKKISVSGMPADIVILAPNADSEISCDNCVFENALRISLLTATPARMLSQNTTIIGSVGAGPQTQITITDLFAPGSIALDLVTRDLSFAGVIDTHSRAMKANGGGFEFVEHGSELVGSASVNLMLGEITWHYETQTLQFARHSGTIHLGGDIRSSAVNASIAGDLVFGGYIDTRTDGMATTNYKDGVYVPQEQVSLIALDGGNLTMNSTVDSGGEVTLQGTGNVLLNSTLLPIKAKSLKVLAQSKVTNLTSIEVQQLGIAADTIVNEGKLVGDGSIELYAVNDVRNQYGGHIVGANVLIESENAVVRNGSRTPYRSQGSDEAYIMDASDSVPGRDSNYAQQGTFYGLQHSVLVSPDGVTKAAKNNAYIVADKLKILAVGFENINPLYAKVNEGDVQVRFAHSLLSQVYVSAEHLFEFKASSGPSGEPGYFLNSSAILAVNQPNARFSIEADSVVNERYRVESILEESFVPGEFRPAGPGETVELKYDKDNVISRTAVYSPPGTIVSLSGAEILAPNSIINRMSYFEIFRDAALSTNDFSVLGLSHGGVSQITLTYKNIPNPHGPSTYSTDSVASFDPRQLDSLFYVNGQLLGADVDLAFQLKNIFEYYAYAAVLENFIAENGAIDTVHTGFSPSTHSNPAGAKHESFVTQDAVENPEIEFGSESFTLSETVNTTRDYYQTDFASGNVTNEYTADTKDISETFHIWDEIQNALVAYKSRWDALLTEVQWWTEEGQP